VLTLPLRREVRCEAVLLLHHRHLLDHHHRWDPHRRSPRATLGHQCLSRGFPLGRLQSWIFLHLWMKRVSSLIPHEMRSSPKSFLMTSTAMSSGHPMMARSSSSVTPMRKKRFTRRMSSTPKLRLLLLQSSHPQTPLSPTPMKLSRGCKMIIVMVLPPIKRQAMATTGEARSARLKLSRKVALARRRASRRTSRVLHCYSIPSFV
jgi:hypothetical protein